MKVYTKTGDQGETSLWDGTRVAKNHPVIEALGSLDELSSHIGKAKSQIQSDTIKKELTSIQQKLILLMGKVAGYESIERYLVQEDVQSLEESIDYYERKSHSFEAFILPGQTPLSAELDIARTVARRAERALATCEGMSKLVKQYINRLSDYLFMLARYIEENHTTRLEEFNLETANQMINHVRNEATRLGINVVIAVVSREGRPISVQVMDEAFVISYELAIKKAFTAAALQMGTHELAQLVARGADFEGLEGMLDEKIITLGGGYPIKLNNRVVGAIGVSGGSSQQDIALAQIGAKLFERG